MQVSPKPMPEKMAGQGRNTVAASRRNSANYEQVKRSIICHKYWWNQKHTVVIMKTIQGCINTVWLAQEYKFHAWEQTHRRAQGDISGKRWHKLRNIVPSQFHRRQGSGNNAETDITQVKKREEDAEVDEDREAERIEWIEVWSPSDWACRQHPVNNAKKEPSNGN
ncbi:hypothetical protein B0H19DRAFT_1064730 [Mycena capillaripes]|nr:hypothetical protein B0H19DRAFT_1064730 [Mycena capillaripes]